MEILAKPQEMEMEMEMDIQTTTGAGTTTTNSPKANGSSCKTPTPPVTPRVISRSEPSTTFIQADTSNFKQVVQMLTGSSETAKLAASNKPIDPPPPSPTKNSTIPPINKTVQKKQGAGFKLYERRNSKKNVFMISPLNPDGFISQKYSTNNFSPRKLEILSPSILDFPSLVLSPVTPLNEDNINTSSSTPESGLSEEEKAIADKKFYLHPSPRTTPRPSDHPPQLLPLFPLTSPRISASSSSDRTQASC